MGIEYPVHDVEIFADILLVRAFDNLLDNSIRHGLKVTKICISTDIQSDLLYILWEDDGVGIPIQDKEKIFDRGFGKNTGLGLFFIRDILAITGITIQEKGIEGKGAKFEIIVPEGSWRYQEKKSLTHNRG